MAVELDNETPEHVAPEHDDTYDPTELLNDILAGKKIVVDAHLWYSFAYLVMTHPEDFVSGAYTPQARLLMLGRVRAGAGAGLPECEKLWAETKAYIARG